MSTLIYKHFFLSVLRTKQKKGFSLVEVIVASVVFSLVVVGMLSIFDAGNQHIIHTRERMTSAELGKFFIDPLQMYVRFDTWDQVSNGLRAPVTISLTPYTINNRLFTASYDTASVPNTDLRRVTTKIQWTEPHIN